VTAPAAVVPIGRPIANVRLLILDAERRLIPAGCPGELWIVGLPVATGYLGEEPGGGFTRDPLGGPDRAYRTGDVVRWLDSGELQFIGRKDRQVKIRGQRIELDEIELALTGLPGVGRAAVHHQTIASGGVLHAFVSGQGGAILSAAALRSALRQMLPSAAVPAHIVTVADLPMLPNGKVDRSAIERMIVAAPGPGVDTPALDFEALAERLRRSG
jgi:acyl-CoA synthetase (AMP-forming)/AMP-acid ligase II